jgi:hypothetical protein
MKSLSTPGLSTFSNSNIPTYYSIPALTPPDLWVTAVYYQEDWPDIGAEVILITEYRLRKKP